MIWRGVALSLCAACTHSLIDVFRKSCSNVGIPTLALVFLPAILDAFIACTGVFLTGGFENVTFNERLVPFTLAIISTSALLLYSKLLYQRALHLSPLSLTIPYLSFTPAFLIVTAFIFVGEVPSPSGVAGVSIVACGGYLLSSRTTGTASATSATGGTSPSMSRTSSTSSIPHITSSPGDSIQEPKTVPRNNTFAGLFGMSSRASMAGLKALDADDRSVGRGHGGLGHQWQCRRSCSGQSAIEGEVSALLPVSSGILHSPEKKRVHNFIPSVLVQEPGTLLMEPGTLRMLGVAVMWSITASLDKFGIMHSPSVWVYFAIQRLVIGLAAAIFLAVKSPQMFAMLLTHFWRLLGIRLLSKAAPLHQPDYPMRCRAPSALHLPPGLSFIWLGGLLFKENQVVAIKRCNILISVLLGGLLFKENVASRLPYGVGSTHPRRGPPYAKKSKKEGSEKGHQKAPPPLFPGDGE
eukprot:gene8149-1402_t